jgi:major vault protein
MEQYVADNNKRDLVLPPGTFAYMQDVTKGIIKTYVGPYVITPTAQEIPVVYDAARKTYSQCANLNDAIRQCASVPEGSYVILDNPAKAEGKHPDTGTTQMSTDLDQGRTVIIPGPTEFALWPGQGAEVVRGHQLRSNQYLLVRVYNELLAQQNWKNAVVRTAAAATPGNTPGANPDDKTPAAAVPTASPTPSLTMGQQLIIRGTEVSFYIPPSGIEVLAENDGGMKRYVREALTLERLEYAILVDEDGNKRYEQGPKVVFPEPTESFVTAPSEKGGGVDKKFRAIELNPIQGIHVKVIADYEEGGRQYKTGEELFITGKETAIYYPREEHSAIKYDGKVKSFATAVPAGEARYVLNRMTGEIRTVRGPAMLLPDPRTEVIVRRVLSDKQSSLWYPGNGEALAYNQGLRNVLANVPTTRSGAVSEGDYTRGTKGATKSAAFLAQNAIGGAYASTQSFMESSKVSGDQMHVGDEFTRGSGYTAPRTVTLDTKYQGAPSLDIWTGYSVLVVSKSGARRVVQGPTTVLLDYDETLEVLEMSTGRPKTTDNLLRTVYLRTDNNTVSDLVNVETADHVNVELKLSYCVDFTGDSAKWFSVENYVKFLCDHARSVLKGAVRKLKVEEFYANSTDLVRDILLGKLTDGKRAGLTFEENGMQLNDIEVLGVAITDTKIQGLLAQSQIAVVQSNIELSSLRRNLDVSIEKQRIVTADMEAGTAAAKRKLELESELAAASLAVTLARISNTLTELEKRKEVVASEEAVKTISFKVDLDRAKEKAVQSLDLHRVEQEQAIARLRAEAETIVQKFEAAQGGFSEALLALSNNETMAKVAEAWSIQRAIGGDSVSDALRNVFAGTSLAPLMQKLTAAPAVVSK